MDAERPIIFEARLPGLCWHCGRDCNQWRVTRPVAVSSCRNFLEKETKETKKEEEHE